jgi:hypothetical protein
MSVNVPATAHQLQRRLEIKEHIFQTSLDLLISVGCTSCDQTMQLRFWHHAHRSEVCEIIGKIEI